MSPAESQLKNLLMAMFRTDPEGLRHLCTLLDRDIAQVATERFPASAVGMSLSKYFDCCLVELLVDGALLERHVSAICDALVVRTPMREQEIRRVQAALVEEGF